jgi:hypothetical protein
VKLLPFLLALTLLLTNCKSREENIQGLWRTDSISSYVNGFSFTNNTMDAHWSYFEYKDDKSVFERRDDEFRKSYYKMLDKNILVYSDSIGRVLTRYLILHLDSKSLVLKKSQSPYLPGKNQELYEVRYFTKISPNDRIVSKKR